MSGPRGNASFLALLALRSGPKHGYEIVTHLEAQTLGHHRLSFGVLYPLLHRLEKDGLVEGNWEELSSQKRRKVYALTRKGRRALEKERDAYLESTRALARLMGETS
jgi:PadR family transcriptional regulator PadR